MARLLALCLGMILALVAPTSAENRPFALADFSRTVTPSDPQLSPDGKAIVVVVARQDYEHDRIVRDLDLIDIASGARRTLTFERTGLGSPRWSPSGDRLAFVADDGDHHGQVWVMSMHGGDAHRITATAEGVQQFAWRPNGESIAYVTTDPAPKKHGPAAKADLFVVGNNDLFTTEAPRPSHLWLVGADGEHNHRLTSGTWSLPVAYPPSPPGAPISWSPDGAELLYTRLADADEGDSYLSALYALDVASGKSRKLTSHDRFESFGLFAPHGGDFAYLFPRDGDPNNGVDVIVNAGGTERTVTRALDRNVYRQIWMPSGDALLLGGDDTTYASMWIQPLNGPARRLDLGDISIRAPFWMDADVAKDGGIAFVGATARHPNEVYYLASPDAKPKRLTDYNAFADGLDLATPEMLTWTNEGYQENGVLWTPPNAVPGRKLPLVLLIHGGPTSASLLTFNATAQAFAAHGFLVFEPNYRGSDHLGNTYEHAIFNDAGAGPGRDVMAGLAAVRARGNVDDARIAVSGWSYGGYMTSWMIGHYHIWKTAVSGAAVNDLIEEYDLSDGNVQDAFSFAGYVSPWKSSAARQLYLEQSPISAFKDIRTPTLILTDMRDARVSPAESFAMYHALKDNGVAVEFKAWPIAGHNPGDPVRLRQRVAVWTDWLVRWLR
jgi:dipeptidyl aminopeptidase/acylaminoacyl peptidase